MALISNKIIDLLSYRIEQEELSSRIYLAMSIWLGFNGYTGAEKLWKSYSEEEIDHSKWAYEYLLALNIKPNVPSIKEPEQNFKGLPQIIAKSYEHEVDITNQVTELTKIAQQEGDFMTFELGLRYCKEQVNELDKTQLLIDKLEAFGTDRVALKLLDQELGEMAG